MVLKQITRGFFKLQFKYSKLSCVALGELLEDITQAGVVGGCVRSCLSLLASYARISCLSRSIRGSRISYLRYTSGFRSVFSSRYYCNKQMGAVRTEGKFLIAKVSSCHSTEPCIAYILTHTCRLSDDHSGYGFWHCWVLIMRSRVALRAFPFLLCL